MLYLYRNFSNRFWPTSKMLQRELHAYKINNEMRPRRIPSRNDVIINFGSGVVPEWYVEGMWLNNPIAVNNAGNKINTLQILFTNDIPCLEFTTSMEEAIGWNSTVYARTLSRGSKGRGIVICAPGEELPRARLYTKKFPNGREYRFHVFKGSVIDYTQKKLRNGTEDPNKLIRSYDNGWVHAHNDIRLPDRDLFNAMQESAVNAVSTLGLDFAAVDMLYSVRGEEYKVCEINSAPAIVNQLTVNAYLNSFREFYNNRHGEFDE